MIKHKLINYLLAALTLTFISWSASGAVVDITSMGAIPDDGIDDTQAFQSAFNSIQQKGGTIYVPNGTFIISSIVRMVPTSPHYQPNIILKGDGSSTIKIQSWYGQLIFYTGNINSFTVKDINFISSNPSGNNHSADSNNIFHLSNTQQASFHRLRFFGIKVHTSIIYSGHFMDIQNVQFLGSMAGESIVKGTLGLTMKNVQFRDYGTYNGVYYSKTGGKWIVVEQPDPRFFNAYGASRVTLENIHFDEGAFTAVELKNVEWADIAGVTTNVNGGGFAIVADNSKATISKSWFGYASNPRPAVKAVNNSTVTVRDIVLGGGVILSETDGTSSVLSE